MACIGPITAKTAEELGLRVDVVASEYTVEGLVRAMKEAIQMTRKRELETTIVWWENLPKDFIEWSDREMEKAEKRWAEEDKKAQKKGEKTKGVIVLQEDEGNADWLKRPSDLIASLKDPKIKPARNSSVIWRRKV